MPPRGEDLVGGLPGLPLPHSLTYNSDLAVGIVEQSQQSCIIGVGQRIAFRQSRIAELSIIAPAEFATRIPQVYRRSRNSAVKRHKQAADAVLQIETAITPYLFSGVAPLTSHDTVSTERFLTLESVCPELHIQAVFQPSLRILTYRPQPPASPAAAPHFLPRPKTEPIKIRQRRRHGSPHRRHLGQRQSQCSRNRRDRQGANLYRRSRRADLQ
jgi:hypothetical protein